MLELTIHGLLYLFKTARINGAFVPTAHSYLSCPIFHLQQQMGRSGPDKRLPLTEETVAIKVRTESSQCGCRV